MYSWRSMAFIAGPRLLPTLSRPPPRTFLSPPSLPHRRAHATTCVSTARLLAPRRAARAAERERLHRVHEQVAREVRRDPTMVPIRTTIPYQVWRPGGLSTRMKRDRVFVRAAALESLGEFRAAVRAGLLRLHPTLQHDPHFGQLLCDNESFGLRAGADDLASDDALKQWYSSAVDDPSRLSLLLTPTKETRPQNYSPPLPQRLLDLDHKSATHVEIMSFYRFVAIDDPDATSSALRRAWTPYGVVGRVYVATEGINAQIAVPTTTLRPFIAAMAQHDAAADDPYTIPPHVRGVFLNRDTTVPRGDAPFRDLRVKPRHKVLADGLDQPLDWGRAGRVVGPDEWHTALTGADGPDPIVLDCRNKYESEVGAFQGAEPLSTNTFRESWEWLEERLRDVPRDSKIMTYCTGGIRCVKVGAYLEQKMGFQNVDRLEGGIVAYSKMVREKQLPPDESTFKGVNYVFDMRIGERVTDDVLTRCLQCGCPCDLQTDCSNEKCARSFAERHFVQCPECAARMLGACSDDCLKQVRSRRRALKSGEQIDIRATSGRIPEEDDVAITSLEAQGYCAKFSSLEPPELAALRVRTFEEIPNRAHNLCGPVEGQMLSMFVGMAGAKRVLELGTFTGYSALWMMRSLGRTEDARLITCDIDEESGAIAREAFGHCDRESAIDFRLCGADEVLDSLSPAEPMDLIFLDANKKQYENYYNKILGRGLLRVGGLLIADNVLFRGRVIAEDVADGGEGESRRSLDAAGERSGAEVSGHPRSRARSLKAVDKIARAIHRFNQRVREDSRTEQVMLPVRDGMTVIRRLS